MKKLLLLFLLMAYSPLSLTQTKRDADIGSGISPQEQMHHQIQEFMKQRDEIFKSLFNDDMSDNLEERMLKMMESFSGGGWPDFNDLGTNDWQTSQTHRILKLKVKQIKDRPLDIKIEKGMIYIKGDAELEFGASKNIVRFERSYSIPQDVDQTSPEFENNDSEIIIKFKFLNKKPNKVAPVKKEINKDLKKEDRVPIGPSESGLSL